MQATEFPEDDRASNELWGIGQLENHARLLARDTVAAVPAPYGDIVDRLKSNRATLEVAYRAIAEALRTGRAITPAAEWFIDNYHIVTEQITDLATQLPGLLWRSLPAGGLSSGKGDPRAESPRIFNLMREYLAHTDCDFDSESLVRYLKAYQEITPLRMRELWLLSPMLRLALLERLRFLSIRMEVSLAARGAADKFADTVLGHAPAAGEVAAALERALKETLRFQPFVVQLVHRLQSMGDERQVPLDFIARQLASRGQNMDDVIQEEHARRSARNLTVRNIVTSLRAITALDWRTMFERTSQVESQLGKEGSYLRCDRRTRDRYRHCIEELARNIGKDESAVVAIVRRQRAEDIGELLIGARRAEFEQEVGYRPALRQRLMRTVVEHASRFYLGSIAATSVIAALLALYWGAPDAPSRYGWWILAALALFPASELAVGIVNWIFIRIFPPRSLPRLQLQQGLSEEARTLVVMPVLLAKPGDATACARLLEVHALANVDAHARFALLTDWTDAAAPRSAVDTLILEEAEREIAALNERDPQPPAGEPRFYLYHRARLWNPHEGCFMGWERKRGKLDELNRLLLGSDGTSFITLSGSAPAVPASIRYVLTLDADTRLPMGSVRELVGIASHPLNQPVIDPATRRVIRGHALLQPRITPLLPTQDERSLYRAITTSGSGLDPYAAAISDLYQDVFSEGLFTGKGLYDLRAFETVMQGRVPENTLLSHDLFEGLFLRCGLVTDVELYEDFPSHSEVAAARSHRWIRGDWQLLPWILGLRGPLPPMGRWKMLDNLRRSLLAPAAVMLMVAAWSIEGAHPAPWMALIALPWLWPGILRFLQPGGWLKAPSRRGHLRHLAADLGDDAARAAVSVALMAQNAWLSVDAIARALLRTIVTKRRRLEWTTAAQSKAQGRNTLASFEWPLKSACIVVVSATACILWFNRAGIPDATPLLALWWMSPLLAHGLSRPLSRDSQVAIPSPDSARELTVIARSTWSFFERFVTAEDHHLPPDNFQQDPAPVVAHRTSPTNIGLYLLSTVAARDFGWLGTAAFSARLTATLQTLQQMERFEGHFLNWYDTRTLAALLPRYVSTVDSGNLVGHLIAVRQAVLQQLQGPALSPRALRGPASAISLFTAALSKLPKTSIKDEVELAELLTYAEQIQTLFQDRPPTLVGVAERFRAARRISTRLEDMSETLATTNGPAYAAVLDAARLVHNDVSSHAQDMDRLVPELAGECPDVAELPLAASLTVILDCHRTALNRSLQPGATSVPRATVLRVLESAIEHTRRTIADLNHIAVQCHALVADTRFGFLYDTRRGLFSIGYRVADAALDDSYYDLLASEARLASLVAIAKTEVPRSHWFRLGRRLTGGSRRPMLASWSGSMFEYLMPSLVMNEPRNSLLGQSVRRAVRQQINYGEAHRIPWGVSESAYNVRDHEMTYQYSAFGLPGLGLKRGLGSDLVIAPYATALAAMIAPDEAAQNFRALSERGARGTYGFHEAIDFTAQRLPKDAEEVVIGAYMAHHQGMALVALANTLHGRSMQDRFHADPMIQAAELLLQERAIRFADVPPMIESNLPAAGPPAQLPVPERRLVGVSASAPVIHLLSNRRYGVMLTDSGAGYSVCASRAVTRWRSDATQDCWGSFIYLRDASSGRFWSAGFQPTATEPDEYEVQFSEEQATFRRRDGAISTTLEVIVSAQDDAELRRVTIRNQGSRTRVIEVTSYAELVMAAHAADVAHPAFSNLSVQTEYAPDLHALLATRRPRSSTEPAVWGAHLLTTSQEGTCVVEYETDRLRFIGRGRSPRSPLVIAEGRSLGNHVGNVLDPIFSLRTCISIEPGKSASVTFVTLLAGSRAQAVALATRYRHPAAFEHGAGSSWTTARAELHHLQSDLYESRLFQSLAGHMLYPTPRLRAGGDVIAANTLDITRLWRFSISGDRPILLIRCQSIDEIRFVRQCLRAQEYLRSKRFYIDVVILNELEHSYFHELQEQIERAVRTYAAPIPGVEGETRGTVHALQTQQLGAEEQTLLQTVARVILRPAQGSLAEHLQRNAGTRLYPSRPPSEPEATTHVIPATAAPDRAAALEFANGLGGFDDNGREYVITLGPGKTTPAPWCNVLANEQFGSLVSESGSMCSWWLNGRENQLSPWSNDAVSDPTGEAFYIHDSESDRLWSPTAQPVRLPTATYEARHGQGYSQFHLENEGIESQLLVFVAHEAPARLARLRLTNHSSRTRRLSVVAYVEWTLGPGRAGDVSHIVTQIDATTGAMLARNSLSTDFGTRVAFCDLGGRQQYWTGSRSEFLGRNGARSAPAGIARLRAWSGHTGGGVDPCCAFAVTLTLAPGATEEVVSVLGQAEDAATARTLVGKFRSQSTEQLLSPVRQQWDRLLGTVQIQTPDRALDLMFNRWLLYQTITCRMWGRAGFYQAGGAFGFRDQLQDSMALSASSPALARQQMLRAAARQFPEGDVQHWWHPPSGRGVRTHCSDDRIWLPYVAAQYLEVTEDHSVLDEFLPFIEGPSLPPDHEDSYFTPTVSPMAASFYEHCARALDVSLGVGVHGLPLIGSGDWNDGMNRVGKEGRGESVWLAWFLIDALQRFAPIAQRRGETERVGRWLAHARALARACETHAWDGAWYRRAFFDDGTPLGSAANNECRIDSLAQTWAVLSGAADRHRAEQAMVAVDDHLIRSGDGLVLLFTPPFDTDPVDPGYIKGYLPGLRENGGQYTHAAIWVLMAAAALRDQAQVGQLLDMLNPVRRTESRSGTQAYRVEPYVIAADIYATPPHARRGGWTWYTGAAGWLHRAVQESVLGIRFQGQTMTVTPCMPAHWTHFDATLTRDGVDYALHVQRAEGGESGIWLDDAPCVDGIVPLLNDGRPHQVRVIVS